MFIYMHNNYVSGFYGAGSSSFQWHLHPRAEKGHPYTDDELLELDFSDKPGGPVYPKDNV